MPSISAPTLAWNCVSLVSCVNRLKPLSSSSSEPSSSGVGFGCGSGLPSISISGGLVSIFVSVVDIDDEMVVEPVILGEAVSGLASGLPSETASGTEIKSLSGWLSAIFSGWLIVSGASREPDSTTTSLELSNSMFESKSVPVVSVSCACVVVSVCRSKPVVSCRTTVSLVPGRGSFPGLGSDAGVVSSGTKAPASDPAALGSVMACFADEALFLTFEVRLTSGVGVGAAAAAAPANPPAANPPTVSIASSPAPYPVLQDQGLSQDFQLVARLNVLQHLLA